MKSLIQIFLLMSSCLPVSGQLMDPRPIKPREVEFAKKNKLRESKLIQYNIDGKKKTKSTYYEVKKYDTNGNLIYSIESDRDKENFINDIYEYSYNENKQLIMEKYTSYSSSTKIDLIAYTKYEYENGHLIQECNYDSAMNPDGYKPCYTYTFRNDTLIALDKYNDCILEYKGDSVFQKTRYSKIKQRIHVDGNEVYINTNDGYEYAYEYNEEGLMSKSYLYHEGKAIMTTTYQYENGIQVGSSSQIGVTILNTSYRYSYKYYK